MKTKITLIAFLITTLLVISCRKKQTVSEEAGYSGKPVLPEEPYDYLRSSNDDLATLGRVLFYDKSLSQNNSVACASCHQQSKAFCDNLKFSTGLEDLKTGRNSPSIFAHQGPAFWDGRANSLADLVLMPVKNHVEMKFDNISALAEKLSSIDYYAPLFEKAFGSSEIDENTLKLALHEFIKNFTFSNNKFNRSIAKVEKLNASESLGEAIFFGKGRCEDCHHIKDPNTGNGNGYGSVPSVIVLGQSNIGLDKVYTDNGVGDITKNPNDYGKFVIPVLLNAEYTAPYMHDGRFNTLEEVVEHYNSGINNHPNLDHRLRDFGNMSEAQMEALDANQNGLLEPSEVSSLPPVRLNLTSAEKKSLVDFLKTLTDPTILTETKFSTPFKIK